MVRHLQKVFIVLILIVCTSFLMYSPSAVPVTFITENDQCHPNPIDQDHSTCASIACYKNGHTLLVDLPKNYYTYLDVAGIQETTSSSFHALNIIYPIFKPPKI